MKISLLISMKMPTIVGIFIFISRENFMFSLSMKKVYNLGARLTTVAQSDVLSTSLVIRRSWVRSPLGLATFFCEKFSMVILSLLLIEEGQLSVSGKRMCTNTD